MPCLKKIGKAVFQIITSGFISEFLYSNSNFSIFAKTWEYYLCTFFALCIKFDVSIFISYGALNIHRIVTHSHTHAHTHIHTHKPISENHFFELREPQNLFLCVCVCVFSSAANKPPQEFY